MPPKKDNEAKTAKWFDTDPKRKRGDLAASFSARRSFRLEHTKGFGLEC
jgi:hypothetical protein